MNAWEKVSRDERIRELNIERHNALGDLLGMVDVVLLAEEHPTIFNRTEKLTRLREARDAYHVALVAYLGARLGV
jgi:hypothetical protein